MARHPLRAVHAGMMDRCHNPNGSDYARYGGRGIKVCQRWRESFAAFVADMGERPSPKHWIDRVDNDGDYEPGNCRWSTPAEQSRNRGNNAWYEFRGERKTLGEWSEITGIPYTTLHRRIVVEKWPAERVFKASKSTGKPAIKSVMVIKATDEWRDWLHRFAKRQGMTAVELIEAALATMAAIDGHEPPPPRLG